MMVVERTLLVDSGVVEGMAVVEVDEAGVVFVEGGVDQNFFVVKTVLGSQQGKYIPYSLR